jgi:hypothetical protein
MKHEDDAVDLASEARRRTLSRDEEARLKSSFEASPEEQMLFRAGLAFDRQSSAREGDDVLVARMANRAAERFGKATARSPSRRRRPLVLLVAAAVVAAGTAAAGSGVVYLMRAERPDVETPAYGTRVAAPLATASPRRARPAPAVVAPAPVAEPPAPRAEPAPEPASVAAQSVKSSKRPAPDASGAAALFGEANKKRLAGDTASAVALYTQVAERYPGSAESNLAELSLGKLFLATGQSERALAYFRRAGASGGALGSEALWGEAGALRALGRSADERSALERLLAQYPSGTYAKAARKRLGTDAP